ncbi:MAG: DUF3638 domain-containing protein, partial [Chlamydiia bacterium]|nr:DUF3638 domain-containing protein [Chlamydiia bacterium]
DHPETSPSIQEKLGVAQPKITTGTRDPLLRPLGLVPAVFSSEPISVAPDLSVRLQGESFIRLISLPEIETQRTELSSQCTEIAATVYGVSRSEPCETRELQHMADALGQYARQWQPRTPMLPCIQDEAAAVRALDLLQLEMVYHVEAAHAASQEIQDLLKLVPTRELGSIEAGLRHEWDLRRIVLQIAQGTMPETPEGLVDAVFRFLIHETEAQMGARAMLKLASLIDRGPIVGFDHTECKDLAQDFANELKPRAYELRSDLETLHCLCFEWLSDKRLFVDQYEKLKALDSDTVLEFQAPTGSGKSSTIFPLFLWLVITRNTRGLTVMTVRDSQLEDQLKLLRALLGDAFGTAIQPFVVDRDMLSSRDGVERSLQLVADARAGKRIILTTPRTVHACLFLAPVAAIGGRELFDLLVKLRTELTDNAIHFVDESKEV